MGAGTCVLGWPSGSASRGLSWPPHSSSAHGWPALSTTPWTLGCPSGCALAELTHAISHIKVVTHVLRHDVLVDADALAP
eukprot:4106515-Pyramimonas_sp.AAC.1